MKQVSEVEGACRDLWLFLINVTCHCGDSICGVVSCDDQIEDVMTLECFCMTNYLATNLTVAGVFLLNFTIYRDQIVSISV